VGKSGGSLPNDYCRTEEKTIDVIGDDWVDHADAVEVSELGLCLTRGLSNAPKLAQEGH